MIRSARKCAVAVAVFSAIAGVGCSAEPSQPVAAASQGDEVTPAESAKQLSEGQIMKVLATADTSEIAQAQLAVTKANEPAVRQFANHMIEQHSRSKQEGASYADQAGITPSVSKLSNKLDRDGSDELKQLQAADGTAFDGAYIKAQVKQHQALLSKLDEELIPAASARTREQLETTRGMVEHHLTQAKEIESTLKQ